MSVTIYHNPRCTKSRQTLALLEEKGISPTVVEYLKDAPSLEQLQTIAVSLDQPVSAMVRHKEAEFKEAGLSKESSDAELLQAITQYPKLLERPIVVTGGKARIGRPPENVLEIL